MQVNAETLQRKIEQLEYWGTCYELTDKERYRLKAYKMLLERLTREETFANYAAGLLRPS